MRYSHAARQNIFAQFRFMATITFHAKARHYDVGESFQSEKYDKNMRDTSYTSPRDTAREPPPQRVDFARVPDDARSCSPSPFSRLAPPER